MHSERRAKKLALKTAERRLVGYTSNGKNYRVDNPVTRCIMVSRNVIYIETPSRLLPPPSEGPQLLMQELTPGDDPCRGNKGHNYITDDDFLHDLRNYTPVVDHTGSASIDYVTARRRSEDTLVAKHSGKISATTRRDLLEDGTLPGEASSMGEVPQGGVLERPEQTTSPAGGSVEAPLAGSLSLQQRGHSRNDTAPIIVYYY